MTHHVEKVLDRVQFVFYTAIIAALLSFFIPCQDKDKHDEVLPKLDICSEVQEVASESELLTDYEIEELEQRCRTQGS